MTKLEKLQERLEELEQRKEEIEEELRDFFELDDLDEYFSELTPLEVFNRFFYGNINGWRPTWIKVNAYANFDDGDQEHDELEEELEKIEEEIEDIEFEIDVIETEEEDWDE